MNTEQTEGLKTDAVVLISWALGDTTAKLYKEFYMDKSKEEVVDSVGELLTESLGEQKAKEKLNALFAKYRLNS